MPVERVVFPPWFAQFRQPGVFKVRKKTPHHAAPVSVRIARCHHGPIMAPAGPVRRPRPALPAHTLCSRLATVSTKRGRVSAVQCSHVPALSVTG